MRNINSIKKNCDFQTVYRTGKSYANKYLVMYVKKNDDGNSRLGISVSKKVGNSVVRHRITRLIRECYRLNQHMFSSGLDIIVVSRVAAKGHNYYDIESALLHLAKLQAIVNQPQKKEESLSLINISEPTRQLRSSFCVCRL